MVRILSWLPSVVNSSPRVFVFPQDKILQSGNEQGTTVVTNDGATILKSIPVDNPSAKIIVDTSKTQDAEVGDGTTSVAVLAGELLREAQQLVLHDKLHPQTIVRGTNVHAP